MTSGFQSHLDDPDLSRVTTPLVCAGIAVRIGGELRILRGEEPNGEPAVTQEHADAG